MPNRTSATRSGHYHAVRFYETPDALSKIVADFIADGLTTGLPAIIIATPEHTALIEAQVQVQGFDFQRLKANGELIVDDAARLLSRFMVDGVPDPTRFRRALIPLIERAGKGRAGCVIRAYGEMVDVLWKSGQSVAAIKVEMLWNELAQTHDFSLLCGYAMGSFYKDATSVV